VATAPWGRCCTSACGRGCPRGASVWGAPRLMPRGGEALVVGARAGPLRVSVCLCVCVRVCVAVGAGRCSIRSMGPVAVAPRINVLRLEHGQRCGLPHTDRSVLIHPACTAVSGRRKREAGREGGRWKGVRVCASRACWCARAGAWSPPPAASEQDYPAGHVALLRTTRVCCARGSR
jgi:hypothetical protein